MALSGSLKTLKSGSSVLVLTSDAKYFTTASEILSLLTKKKKRSGVYISISKPYDKVVQSLKGVDFKSVLFLDAISKQLGKKSPESGNCIYVQGPTALTEIGICLTKTSLKTDLDFVFIDSVSSLLAYNNDKVVLRFIQYLFSKSENLELNVFIIASDKDEDRTAVKTIKEMSDVTVKA